MLLSSIPDVSLVKEIEGSDSNVHRRYMKVVLNMEEWFYLNDSWNDNLEIELKKDSWRRSAESSHLGYTMCLFTFSALK